MMMRIFGAALIVSGGYLFGLVRANKLKCRYRVMKKLEECFREFDGQLREYRRSLQEYSEIKPEWNALIGHDILTAEERERISTSVKMIQVGSFRESLEASGELLRFLDQQRKGAENDAATTGKALPLVMAAIGLLVAVLLF